MLAEPLLRSARRDSHCLREKAVTRFLKAESERPVEEISVEVLRHTANTPLSVQPVWLH